MSVCRVQREAKGRHVTPSFRRFLRLAAGGKYPCDRAKLLRDYLRSEVESAYIGQGFAHDPEVIEQKVLANLKAIQAQPPENIEEWRQRLLAFQAAQRAERRATAGKIAAAVRWGIDTGSAPVSGKVASGNCQIASAPKHAP